MQEPRSGGINDITQTTSEYAEAYVALELLHCTVAEYVQRTSRQERMLYQFYVMLKAAKERHAHEEAQRNAEAQREEPSTDLQWG